MGDLLANKIVLVTGAAAGIGRAIAVACAQNGATLVLGDIDEKGLAETAKIIGADTVTATCDVRDYAQIEALVDQGTVRFGRLDVVYANAGIEGPLAPPWEVSEEDFARVIDINVNGTWRTMKAVLPGMLKRGSGAIVATASVAGLVGAAGLPAYVASKHAVVGLVKSTAVSVASSGIRVNAICPGMVSTAMYDRLLAAEPKFEEALMAFNPMQRLASADEIAQIAVWLGCDQAGYITGHALAADGGYVAQ